MIEMPSATKQSGKSKKDKINSKIGKGKKTKKSKIKNLLLLIPERNCEWKFKSDNKELIRLFKPKFETNLGNRIGKKLKIKPNLKVNLDEYGTTVWRLCDGKLTVKEIAEILKTQFGESVEPLYPRLGEFFRILESNDLIIMKSKRVKKKRKVLDY
jgi:hypothetical protein